MRTPCVLVVEDESITAADIRQSLLNSGYSVPAIAFSGEEAIAEARRHRPELVLMDISLRGGMDGIEAACRIHQELQIPVIFLTAYADSHTLERAKSAEPFAYLLKPFEETILATTIEIALHKHRAHELLVRQAAQELDLSHQRFKALVDNLADYAVVLLDATGVIVSWSPGAERAHHWAAGEILGKHVSTLYSAGEIQERKPDRNLQAAAHSGRRTEYSLRVRKDQSSLPVHSTLIALRNSFGGLAGFLEISREVIPAQHGN